MVSITEEHRHCDLGFRAIQALLGWLGPRWSVVVVQPDTENEGWHRHACEWNCICGKTVDEIRSQVRAYVRE